MEFTNLQLDKERNKISYPTPLYVTRIDSDTGIVYVGEEKYLYRTGFSF